MRTLLPSIFCLLLTHHVISAEIPRERLWKGSRTESNLTGTNKTWNSKLKISKTFLGDFQIEETYKYLPSAQTSPYITGRVLIILEKNRKATIYDGSLYPRANDEPFYDILAKAEGRWREVGDSIAITAAGSSQFGTGFIVECTVRFRGRSARFETKYEVTSLAGNFLILPSNSSFAGREKRRNRGR